MESPAALPPETLEGWYALHQLYTVERRALRSLAPNALRDLRCVTADSLGAIMSRDGEGWSAVVPLVGSTADVLFIHFRPTLDDLREIQHRVDRLDVMDYLRPAMYFLSVTELGLHQLAAHGQDDPQREARLRAERESPHTLRRLYPPLPENMPYVSFYPMSKRRDTGQNWYTLPLPERSKLMHSHGLTGRRYAGRVTQIITGAIGLDKWEWGVTLFAKDPVDFKKLVTEMRFDEASAKYAEFGDFYVGRIADADEWAEEAIAR
ncbi:MAG TPA: hydrogen peroxide-dependent heme synthase [Gemmatimonadaceae bacterium]|nr:hydrogen peroxide-dependent heme synthase [Gemmatimonadaceae bacterium]